MSDKTALFGITLLAVICILEGYRLPKESTYIILAPKSIWPLKTMQVSVTILQQYHKPVNVWLSIRKGAREEVAAAKRSFDHPSTAFLSLQMPKGLKADAAYTLRVLGTLNDDNSGVLFRNETVLEFSEKYLSVFIMPNKPVYRQTNEVLLRAIPLSPDLKPVHDAPDININDPTGTTVRTWGGNQINVAGIIEKDFKLPDQIHYGTWEFEVDVFGTIYKKEIDFEEFFLTALDINVTMPHYLYQDDHGIGGKVEANLTVGQPVRGTIQMKCEIRLPLKEIEDGKEYNWPTIIQEKRYYGWATAFYFTMEELKAALKGTAFEGQTLVGKELYIEAEVFDWFWLQKDTGSRMAVIYSNEVILEPMGDPIRTFKPEIPFTIYYAARHPDGTPVHTDRRQVTITLEIRSQTGSTITPEPEKHMIGDDSIVPFTFYPEKDTQYVAVKASYDKFEKFSRVILYRYYSPADIYIAITTSTLMPMVNEEMIFTIYCTEYVSEVYFNVLAKNNILTHGVIGINGKQKTFALSLSDEMAPKAHILIWYISESSGEVISDALHLFINSTYANPVNVTFNNGKDMSGSTMEVIGRTDPLSFLYFSAQDFELYRFGGDTFLDDITIIEEMKSWDKFANDSFHATWRHALERRTMRSFPAPSYAIDTFTTFDYVGLVVFTDANITRVGNCNITRGDLPCHSGDCYKVEDRCNGGLECVDGADEMGCPKVIEDKNTPVFKRLGRHTRHLEESGKFMWFGHYVKPDGRVDIPVNVPVEPMFWVNSGFSISREKGLSIIHHHARYDATRNFYIKVEMPSQAIMGEQLGVRVVIFNYWDTWIECIVKLHESDKYKMVYVDDYGVVSSYNPQLIDPPVEIMVYIEPNEVKEIQFPVLPLVDECIDVTITAVADTDSNTETVQTCVQFDGVTNYYHTPYLIDMVTVGSTLTPDMEMPVPERFVIPGQREHLYVPGSQKATVNIIGDVVGPMFFAELDAESLLRLPYGSADQTLFNYAYNAYSWKYLRETNLLQDEWQDQVFNSIQQNLIRVMAYYTVKDDKGYFSNFRDYAEKKPSLWTSAFALKTFQHAREQAFEDDVSVDVGTLNQLALWICDQQNKTLGSFIQTGPTYDRKMASNATFINGTAHYSNISLTAFVLISLKEAKDLSGGARRCAETAIGRGLQYLERHIDDITDPYQMSIVTYALHLVGSNQRGYIFRKLEAMKRTDKENEYWSSKPIPVNPVHVINTIPYQLPRKVYDNEAHAIETTSYGLLTYMLRSTSSGRPEKAAKLVKWLQTVRNSIGGFSSTMDTIVALQALAEYSSKDPNRHLYNMRLTITATSTPGWQKIVDIKRENYATLQKVQIPKVFGQVKVKVEGNGLALMQMETKVNVEWKKLQYPVPQPEGQRFFELDHSYQAFGKNYSQIEMHVCSRWLRPDLSNHSGLAALEVDVPTGYQITNNVLRSYVQSHAVPSLARAEMYGRKVVFYFDHLESARKTCVDFKLDRWFPVANVSIQHLVRVYDYYEPGMFNQTLYTTYGLFNLHICFVCGSYQCPYCPYYNSAPKILSTNILAGPMAALLTYLVITWIQRPSLFHIT